MRRSSRLRFSSAVPASEIRTTRTRALPKRKNMPLLSAALAIGGQTNPARVGGKPDHGSEREVVRALQDILVFLVNLRPALSPTQVALDDPGERVVLADLVQRLT